MPKGDADFENWVKTNVSRHRAPGYAIATISLKPIGGVPGDASAEQMDALADLMDQFGIEEIRVSATSRTSSCRMCASAICPRSTRG